MNHYHGTVVRREWPIGTKVKFKPKDLIQGEELIGEIIGHMYVNVLIIKSHETEWKISTFRCSIL